MKEPEQFYGTTAYTFNYGSFGLTSSIQIGSRTLASYSYTSRTNYLSRLDYGNGNGVQYSYDTLGRVTAQTYEDGDTLTYWYNNDGDLASTYDSAIGRTTTYIYDGIGRLVRFGTENSGLSYCVKYGYDSINNLTTETESINGSVRTTSYAYDADNRLTSVATGSAARQFAYDAFSRNTTRTTRNGSSTVLTDTFTYKAPSTTQTSGQVASMQSSAAGYHKTYTYTYDNNGNILSISDGSTTTSYVYDTANQLTRENNQAAGKTWVYTYDRGGNITSKQEYAYTTGTLGSVQSTKSYTYGDSQWGDLLTGYNGQTVTSDAIGNMLSDGSRTFTWEHGRQLKSLTYGGSTWNFTYATNGLRTARSNGSTSYSYVYNGSRLSRMTVGGNTLDFTYAGGSPVSVTYNGTTYYYVTNLQGDITAILNTSGTAVVNYTYDAWGNLLALSGSMASTLGVHNPLRYRGYVYDTETGLYYVSSRYYDPEIGRFINADDVDYLGAGSNLTSYNLFAYCGNNPVMGYDPTGHWDWGGVIAGLGIIAGTVITVATFGIGSPIGAIIAGAAITTGAVTTYAAATDSTMVVDLSYSKQVLPNYYVKGGGSVVIDFKDDNANFYPHIGFGKGYSDGLSYSVGMVDNYEHPDDYAKHFIDINVGYNAGFDHCWNPLEKHDSATQATAVTFSSGGSFGVGYDYYFGPKQILAW